MLGMFFFSECNFFFSQSHAAQSFFSYSSKRFLKVSFYQGPIKELNLDGIRVAIGQGSLLPTTLLRSFLRLIFPSTKPV